MLTDRGLCAHFVQEEPIPLDVSIECRADELLALVGPSGSGKSTILRCLAGLNSPTAGFIRCIDTLWDMEKRINVPTRKRGVGMVFQNYGLFDHMNARENIAIALSSAYSRSRKDQIDLLLEQVNLAGLGERLPSQLSGGQRQRIALARALASEPRMLLLDEPFSAVDLMTRKKLRRELVRVRRNLDIPVVLVTHDLEEALELADKLCILHRGITLTSAPPTEVMQQPKNTEVAKLIGLTNLFIGEIAAHDEEAAITTIHWNDRKLECMLNRKFSIGEQVEWVIPSNRIILHQRVRPSRGQRENPLMGTITDIVTLGDVSNIEFSIDGENCESLSFSVPVHVAERNSLMAKDRIGVSLQTQGIHLMHPIKPPSNSS